MKALIAIDLDQTLLYSLRSGGEIADPRWVEEIDGKSHTYITRAAHSALVALAAQHIVVPVTTRTPAQYHRLELACDFPDVLCANGGIHFREGVRDVEWDARIKTDLGAVAPIAAIRARLEQVQSEDWVRTIAQVEDLFLYLVAETREAMPSDWIEVLREWALPLGWMLSVQGRKLYLVPEPLGKGRAVSALAESYGAVLLAAGDSLLDVDMLDRATYAVRPSHGEIHDSEIDGDGRWHVTPSSGPRAAEELLAMLGAAADELVG